MPRPATADVPIAGMLGFGVSRVDDSLSDAHVTWSLDAAIAYRVTRTLSLGLRGSFGGATDYSYCLCGGGGDDSDYDFSTRPIDAGVTAIYEYRPLWVAPWVGQHISIGSETSSGMELGTPVDGHTSYVHEDFLMAGLSAGVDVLERDGNRLAVYADYRHSIWNERSETADDPRFTSWSSLTLGLAYRR
ncbi:MAG TPA: hypothetical protein VGG28_17720 [Kofleriaceae bacterium]